MREAMLELVQKVRDVEVARSQSALAQIDAHIAKLHEQLELLRHRLFEHEEYMRREARQGISRGALVIAAAQRGRLERELEDTLERLQWARHEREEAAAKLSHARRRKESHQRVSDRVKARAQANRSARAQAQQDERASYGAWRARQLEH